jgi:hypothetical protein
MLHAFTANPYHSLDISNDINYVKLSEANIVVHANRDCTERSISKEREMVLFP